MHRLYQLYYHSAPWHLFRYTIKSRDILLYQVRRSVFRKYRPFEDRNNQRLFYIGVTTIKSIDNDAILANMQINEQIIETFLGNFILTDINLSQRSYNLKFNNNIIAQVTREWCFPREQDIIQIKDINEKHHAFIFALLILIDSALETISNIQSIK